MERQRQNAGDNAQQVQVMGDLVIAGVTEERAREIARNAAAEAIAEYSQEAQEIGMARIGKLDERLVEQMVSRDQLDAFRDPGFQILLRKAQRGAASTERENDYDMLAQLLADRAERGDYRPVRAAIDRAVEVVELVDGAALTGLTVLQAAGQFHPVGGFLDMGLDALDRFMAQLLECELPLGLEWAEHLEILGAVRISTTSKFKKYGDFFSSKVDGYLASGVEAHEQLGPAMQKFADLKVAHLPPAVLHELKPGYARLAYVNMASFNEYAVREVLEENRAAASAIASEDFGLGSAEAALMPAFRDALAQRPALKVVAEWWDQIPQFVGVTAIGRVLARANAQRCDSAGMLPPLD